ncbi:hypothetical protein K440DRAFT_660940 [Wilcoxina mikolae CBS 423.85]|nr:hypothetical protein K440DRAFT_660940 [Wilcoxina mikolae CBS 423.85]
MPSDARTAGKIVFVGNIPYGLTEEQISEIFSSAGRVLSFRLVYDRETGRPKGFGFAEYSDAETAASAVRNLDNYEIMGRKLRVDFSHEGNAPDDVDTSAYTQQQPVLPPGADVPEGITAPDAISNTLKQLPVPQLLEILGQMKTLVQQDPMKATELLRQAPQLSYAIFQALLLMNLVDTAVLTQVIEGAAAAAAPPPPPPQAPAPPVAAAPPQQQYYQATPPPQPVAPTPQPQVQDPQRAQLLQSVMHLTPEQIAAFPPEQQQQIMYLKQSLMAAGGAM